MCFISAPSGNDPEAISSAEVATCLNSLTEFLAPYQAQLQRVEQKGHLQVYVEGLVSGLQRKSIEPIATAHGLCRRPLQHFVGAGKWSDEAVRDQMRRHIVAELGDPAGVLIIDGSAVPKKGTESVGVARQYCVRWTPIFRPKMQRAKVQLAWVKILNIVAAVIRDRREPR